MKEGHDLLDEPNFKPPKHPQMTEETIIWNMPKRGYHNAKQKGQQGVFGEETSQIACGNCKQINVATVLKQNCTEVLLDCCMYSLFVILHCMSPIKHCF